MISCDAMEIDFPATQSGDLTRDLLNLAYSVDRAAGEYHLAEYRCEVAMPVEKMNAVWGG